MPLNLSCRYIFDKTARLMSYSVSLLLFTAALFFLGLSLSTQIAAQTFPIGFTTTTVASGLSLPTAFAVHPDGRVFICQQGGALRVVKNGALLPTPFTTITVSFSSSNECVANDTGGTLFTVNLTTGAGSLVGSLPTGATTEIEYDQLTGRAFAQAGGLSFFGSEFNITTGAAIGGFIINDHTFTGLEWVGSTLYGTSIDATNGPSTLRILNPWTGVSSSIGLTGVGLSQ